MAANELTPEVPGISISRASDEENDSTGIDNPKDYQNGSNEHDNDLKNDPNDLGMDDNGSRESNDELENDSDSKDVSQLAEKLDDIGLDGNDEKLINSADVIGDRVLVERDGKFELVDIAEVKAEYFLMKGIDEKLLDQEVTDEKPAAGESIIKEKKNKKGSKESTKKQSPRPKTSPMRGNPTRTMNNNRVASATVTKRHNDEYSYIKSKYAMTEHQLEMKRKREEAIGKRKKEEEQRMREEMERKREEAESAFQAWLSAKNEEYLEQRRSQSSSNEDKTEREKAAKDAYDSWLHEKAKQRKQEREMEKRKLEDEASSYVIRERQACEEAFRRWLKEKQLEERRKLAAKKPKKQKKKRRVHKSETLPINSSSIRFTDYYGYSHTVAL